MGAFLKKMAEKQRKAAFGKREIFS